MSLETTILLPIILLHGIIVGLQTHIYYNDVTLILLRENESKCKDKNWVMLRLSSIEQPLQHLHRISKVLMILSLIIIGLTTFITIVNGNKEFGILLFSEMYIIILVISDTIASLSNKLQLDAYWYTDPPVYDKVKRILLRVDHKSNFSIIISLIGILVLTITILQIKEIIPL